MDNFNERQIYTEDDWQSLSTPIVKRAETATEDINPEPLNQYKVKQNSKHLVLTIQLTFAICVLLFLFVLKFLDTPLFDTIMSWYDTKSSESVIFNGDFESLDFSSLFATADEG